MISDSTESDDRGRKFEMYRTLELLTDYLLVAQDEPLVEHFSRLPDGRWALSAHRGMDAAVAIASIDCALALADVYDKIDFEARLGRRCAWSRSRRPAMRPTLLALSLISPIHDCNLRRHHHRRRHQRRGPRPSSWRAGLRCVIVERLPKLLAWRPHCSHGGHARPVRGAGERGHDAREHRVYQHFADRLAWTATTSACISKATSS